MTDTVAPEATAEPSAPKLERYVSDAVRAAGTKAADLTDEQRARALDAPNTKKGLRGKALAEYVLDGKTSAPKPKEREARKSTEKKERKPRANSAYGPEIHEAVKKAKSMAAKKPGLDPAKHVPAAGPIQHHKVRTVVSKEIEASGKEVTADTVLEIASGGEDRPMTVAQLRKIASFESDKASLKPLRALGGKFGTDGWSKGRYLAGILAVWAEELKKA